MTLASRVLLGTILLLGGLNGFLRLLPVPEFNGPATFFLEHLRASGFLALVKATEVVAGLVLLRGRRVPLGLVLAAPILVGIVFFHLRLDSTGALPAATAATAWGIVAWDRRRLLLPLLAAEGAGPKTRPVRGPKVSDGPPFGAHPAAQETARGAGPVSPAVNGQPARRAAAGQRVA